MKHHFEIKLQSDLVGYSATASDVKGSGLRYDTKYCNSEREATQEILAKLRSETYNDFTYYML